MRLGWSALLAVIACGPTVSGAGEGSTSTGGTTGSSVGGDEFTNAPPTGGPGDPTTSTSGPIPETTSGSSSSSESGGSSSTGCADEESGAPPRLCGPSDEGEPWYNMRFDEDEFDEESIDITVDCVVDAITVEDADDITFAFTCDDGGHQLGVYSNPPIDLGLAVGDAVHLRVARNYPIDSGGYQFVALRDAANEFVLATYQTWHGIVPPEVDLVSFYMPIAFASVDMGCEAVPYDPPGCGSSFVIDSCATDDTRLAAEFTLGDATTEIWSGTVGMLGDLRVRADVTFQEPVGDGIDCPFTEPYTTFWWTALRPAT